MDNSFQHKSIFQQNIWVSIFALTAAVVWGWAYPLIKMGFAEFGIQSSMTESKMLFAGIRFFFSGLIILLLAKKTKRSFRMKKASAWWLLGIYALVNTTLHYTFFYLGLSYSAGSRAAIYNSLSVFAVVIFAGLFYGRFYKLVFNVRQCFCFTWMSSRLSHRIFLSFIRSRSPLRSLVKNKNLRHDSRKYIAS